MKTTSQHRNIATSQHRNIATPQHRNTKNCIFFLITCIILISFQLNAQNEPILDHNWKLEQVVTADSTLVVPNDMIILADFFDFGNNNFSLSLGYCQLLESLVDFDNQNQSFVISETTMPLGDCNMPEILSREFFLFEEFLFEDLNNFSNPYQPFSYTFTEEGDLIHLDITNSEGDVATFWASTLSNENFEEIEFSIYPNPAKDLLHMESQKNKIEQITIYNLNGKQVLNSTYNENQPIDISNLAKGMYLVKVKTENGSLTKKLIKD
ncbi:T9SS type A sorting domain-containing protein [Psychroflexus planctonicus]|uniref:Secretion system C-terminal sorting domain-containing protein n=1 Tax=Psychroflexus planctonicus TaxID=1526575 RepID=A0ABQ1SMN0_9FLAO|nr:T9SS type A sorting domain-containing protein [Psychroflexus planctonicus]GGE44200.1 hypothetical protein GCM10010832_25280 [Psychroflexus planctonicus]